MAMRFCLLLMAGALYAQQVVAPTPEPVGSARGQAVGNYNVTDSVETGYRFSLIDGDLAKYRSDVNYGNGIRLLGSSVTVDSKDGHGVFFDQIRLNTLGLGNDPYQSASFEVQKNGLYRYGLLWRLDEFYNPGLVGSNRLDQMDTRRRLQDHDITLFPQSHFKVRLGYSRNDQTGPALSSVQEFNDAGAVFPIFMDVRREWNEYRLGAEGEFAGFKFTVQHRWDFFKDDSAFSNAGALSQFTRFAPYHGASPGWFGNLFTNRKRWGMNARMTYVGGQGDFALNELASGSSAGGAAATRQILVSGTAQRPELAGDLSLSLYPTGQLTVVNNTSVHNTRIVGDSNFIEFNNATGLSSSVNFEYMGVRTVANATDLNYRVTSWLGFYAGFHYSDRLISTIDGFAVTGPLRVFPYSRNDHMNSGILGIQLRPVKPFTIRLDGEVGKDNHPLTPVSERNYHTLGGRADYRTRQLQLWAAYRQVYNVNSTTPLSPFSSHSRDYSANASWAPKNRFSLDASYMKLHLDTVSGLAFFAGNLQTLPTIYISNIHAANFGAHFILAPRVNLYVGYSITKDTGDGRGSAALPSATGAVQTLFSSVQTFPLTYQSPLARLSIRITPKIRWNAGWQFYRYREEFGLVSFLQNYRAHTGYTSVLWSF